MDEPEVTSFTIDPDATYLGADHGAQVSIIVVQARKGYGPALHLHDYREVIVVHAGQAQFTAGALSFVGSAGDVVNIPPRTPHRFEVIGDELYVATDIHESPVTRTTWL